MRPLRDEFIYFRIKLHNLTNEQKQKIKDLSDLSRFSYNWALEQVQSYYAETGKHLSPLDMDKRFKELRQTPGYEWLLNFNITTPRYAFRHLEKGFQKAFKKKSRIPKFHSKKVHGIRFAFRGEKMSFILKGKYTYVSIPGICRFQDNLIDCGEITVPIGKEFTYNNAIIKFDGLDYYLTFSVKCHYPFQMDDNELAKYRNEPLGIDLGVRTPAALSDGTIYENPYKEKIDKIMSKIRNIQSAIGRDRTRRLKESARTRTKFVKVPKSNREIKRETVFLKLHKKVHNIYDTLYHQISRQIVDKNPEFVVMEGFNIEELVRDSEFSNKKVAIYQARMGTLRSYIKYKCEEQCIPVILADDEYPSTQLCSRCKHTYPIGKTKIYRCPHCGLVIDRDINAAINLRDYGFASLNCDSASL